MVNKNNSCGSSVPVISLSSADKVVAENLRGVDYLCRSDLPIMSRMVCGELGWTVNTGKLACHQMSAKNQYWKYDCGSQREYHC